MKDGNGDEGYLVTCECEILVRAQDEDGASLGAITLLNGEADIISGKVLDVSLAGDMDIPRLADIEVR